MHNSRALWLELEVRREAPEQGMSVAELAVGSPSECGS